MLHGCHGLVRVVVPRLEIRNTFLVLLVILTILFFIAASLFFTGIIGIVEAGEGLHVGVMMAVFGLFTLYLAWGVRRAKKEYAMLLELAQTISTSDEEIVLPVESVVEKDVSITRILHRGSFRTTIAFGEEEKSVGNRISLRGVKPYLFRGEIGQWRKYRGKQALMFFEYRGPGYVSI